MNRKWEEGARRRAGKGRGQGSEDEMVRVGNKKEGERILYEEEEEEEEELVVRRTRASPQQV